MASAASPIPASAEAPAAARHSLNHIPELDGIRGIAALLVFGHHAFTTTARETLQGGWPLGIQILSRTFEFGNTGVDLFFVLSGFLITSILIAEKKSARFYQDFYWKRALRILPLYLLTLAIVWVFFRQTVYTLMAVAFVVNFAGPLHVRVAEPGPFWSLAIEEQFYLAWPTLVRRLNVRNIFRCSIALGIASILLRAAFAWRNHHDYQMSFLRADGLAFGAAMACHFYTAGNDLKKRRKPDALLCLLALAGSLLIAARDHLRFLYDPAFQTGVVLITVAIVGLSISHSGSVWLSPLRSRLLTFFGLISYAMYMVNVYVIDIYKHYRGPLATGDVLGYWTEIAITFLGTISIALLSRYILELPAMRLRKYVLSHPNRNAEHADPPLPLAQM